MATAALLAAVPYASICCFRGMRGERERAAHPPAGLHRKPLHRAGQNAFLDRVVGGPQDGSA